jgi:hypothetical protein
MVSALSLLLCLLALELLVFRLLLLPDDVLPNVSINNVVRYMPGTTATFRHPDKRRTVVRINQDGWNSTKQAYARARSPGVLRIAVIGDSYVHGAFIDTEDGFPEVIERELNAAGVKAEVLRFGMDGAPLSQYLHMLRNEVRQFRPDIVVVQLIHNDFDESYRFLHSRTGSSFMKVATDQAGRIVEIPPVDFRPGLADVLRNSAAFRYLYYETNAYLTFKHLISSLYWGGDDEWRPELVSSAVDVRRIGDHAKNRLFTRYVMHEMQMLAARNGFRLAFVMDGVREAVYAGRPPESYEVGALNRIAAEVTAELGLPFLDLQEAFQRDWAAHRQRFEYAYDWHWNSRANVIVGTAIVRFLRGDARIIGRTAFSFDPGTGERDRLARDAATPVPAEN